ncbi:LysM peptidoglycan-binding domain-containing protein [Vagococcus zengguangii]|nr:LysM peptidoglycan-binding domain-containing protein [Vagococcus zengguangii]
MLQFKWYLFLNDKIRRSSCMAQKHSDNNGIDFNYRFSIMKKSTSLLGTTLAMGSFVGLIDGSQVALADSLDKVEGKQENDKLAKIDNDTITSFSSQADFVYKIGSLAQVVADEHDLYASIMVAQAILESSWGNSALASYPNHNLFGIKGAYNNQSVIMRTWEHYNGKDVYVNAAFRKYPSYKESLYDNAYVLRNTSFVSGTYYYAGAWKSNSRSYRDATAWLTGRYATDPNYGSKLNSIIERYNLTAFDTPGSHPNVSFNGTVTNGGSNGTSLGTTSNQSTKPQAAETTGTTTYKVKAGDTLFSIARKNNVSVTDIRTWNKLSGDLIYVGQTLKTSKTQLSGQAQSNNVQTNNQANKESNTTLSSAKTYKVKANDTLYGVATKHGISVAQLKSWNKLTGDTIYVGQTLKLGSTTAQTNTQSNKETTNNQVTSSNKKTHQVTAGDTLFSIARNYGISVAQLKSWNKISGDLIFVGQNLTVKQSQSTTTNNAQSTTTNQSNNNNKQTTTAKSYTVKANDTLYRIATTYGVTMSQLKEWNALKSDVIYVGQKLKIVAPTTTAQRATNNNAGSTQPTANTTTTNTSSSTYTVAAGDTLFSIASRHGLSVENLQKLNNLRNHIIYVGQKLNLKASGMQAISQTPTVQANRPAEGSETKKHEVIKGDTLYSIAKKNKLTVKELKELNKLTNDAIYIGQSLKVK